VLSIYPAWVFSFQFLTGLWGCKPKHLNNTDKQELFEISVDLLRKIHAIKNIGSVYGGLSSQVRRLVKF
jgi:hypothetical protein